MLMARDRVEELEEVLRMIAEWGSAYPIDMFPEPDWARAQALLEAGGMTLDAVSAGVIRRTLRGVRKLAKEALNDGE
jgi:hypothetical protein